MISKVRHILKRKGAAIIAALYFLFFSVSVSGQTLPLISDVSVSEITETSALIKWSSSDEKGISFIKIVYGTSENYDKTAYPRTLGSSVTGEVMNLETRIEGLSSGTKYYFRIQIGDSENQTSIHKGEFTTLFPDLQKPVISNISASPQSDNATISWTTDEPTVCKVEYYEENGPIITKEKSELMTSHHLFLGGLEENTTYYYRVRAADKVNNYSVSQVFYFKTKPRIIPPNNVSDLRIITNESTITIKWKNPLDKNFDQVQIYKKIGSPISSRLESSPIFSGRAESFTDREIIKGKPYYYTIYAKNNLGLFSGGAIIVGSVGEVSWPNATTIIGSGKITAEQLKFFSEGRHAEIPLINGAITLKEGVSFSVGLAKNLLSSIPDSITVRIHEGGIYQFVPETSNYFADFLFPEEGRHEAYVQVEYPNGHIDVVPFSLESLYNDAPLIEDVKKAEHVKSAEKEIIKTSINKIEETAIVIKSIKDNSEIESLAEELVPTLTGVAVFNVFSSISLVNLIPFIHLIFFEPVVFLGRRRRVGWGKVYNSKTQEAIDLAVVRLVNKQTGALVQSKVTDSEGRFAFVAKPGEYTIQVSKSNFIFPSDFLKGIKDDGQMFDIYRGKTFEVTKGESIITANIPLDPLGNNERPLRVIFQQILSRAQITLSWFGLSITVFALIISPRWYMWLLLAAQIYLFLLSRRVSKPLRIKNWGIIYDLETKKPIDRAIVRLYTVAHDKLVATQVTDSGGRYHFLAAKDRYFIVCESPTHEQVKTPIIDMREKKKQSITIDIGLKQKRSK